MARAKPIPAAKAPAPTGMPAAAAAPGIGATMLRLRRARALSLDDLAQRSGISKSMLSQIERDRTNPTVATLWRIAGALGVGIERILAPPAPANAVDLLPVHGTPGFTSADGRMHWRILGPVELAGRFEWYELRAEPHSQTVSEGHEPGATEHLTVLQGEITVSAGSHERRIGAGATARYRADLRHGLRNDTDAPAVAMVVVTRVP